MKTITEYQPLIFSRILGGGSASRDVQPSIWSLALITSYAGVAWFLIADTGFALWNWQFWMMFAPIFGAGELALFTIRGKLEIDPEEATKVIFPSAETEPTFVTT